MQLTSKLPIALATIALALTISAVLVLTLSAFFESLKTQLPTNMFNALSILEDAKQIAVAIIVVLAITATALSISYAKLQRAHQSTKQQAQSKMFIEVNTIINGASKPTISPYLNLSVPCIFPYIKNRGQQLLISCLKAMEALSSTNSSMKSYS